MKTNLLLLDSYNKIEELLAYAISFSNQLKRQLKIKYVFDFNWMVESYMDNSLVNVDPTLIMAEKNAQEELKGAEKTIRDIITKYKKDHSIDVPYDIEISSTNRIDTVQDEYENNSEMILLIGNLQSYTEATHGLIGYPNLINHVKCPILVIPKQVSKFEAKKVMYATDYQTDDIEALSHLFKLLQNDDSIKFTILHNQKNADFEQNIEWTGFKETVKKETGLTNVDFQLTSKDETLEAIKIL